VAPRRESSVVEAIAAWLRTIPGCEFRKRWGGPYTGNLGDPDLYGSLRIDIGRPDEPLEIGAHFEIEVKLPGERPRRNQVVAQRRWHRTAAVVGTVHSLEEARILLAPLLDARRR